MIYPGILDYKTTIPYSVWDGLTDYWRFEDASAAVGPYDLTPSTTITYPAGKHNNCADLATAKYYTVTADGSGHFDNQIYSIGGWVWISNTGGYNIIWSYDFTSHTAPTYYASHIRTHENGTSITFAFNREGTSKAATSEANVVLNNWNHIICTMDPSAAKIYLNGTLSGSNTTYTGNVYYYNQEVWIGRANFAAAKSKPKIDEWGYWNRKLSDPDVSTLYNAGAGIYY